MKRNTMSYKVRQYLMFAGPATLLFCGVVVIPLIYGLYLTFTSWDGISTTKPFVGFANYAAAFGDGDFWVALGRTLIYSAIAVILVNVVAFLLAYMVTRGIKGQNFFRAGFFIPNLIGGIVLGYIWQFVFNKAFTAIGANLNIGFLKNSWLSTPHGAMACMIIVAVWQYAGYMMLIYVAGIVPLMRASFVQCLFLTITRCFMVYDVNLSLTNGEPYNSSVMAAMHVYRTAFTNRAFGTGQAEALILFIVCAIVGVTQVYIGRKGEVAA